MLAMLKSHDLLHVEYLLAKKSESSFYYMERKSRYMDEWVSDANSSLKILVFFYD